MSPFVLLSLLGLAIALVGLELLIWPDNLGRLLRLGKSESRIFAIRIAGLVIVDVGVMLAGFALANRSLHTVTKIYLAQQIASVSPMQWVFVAMRQLKVLPGFVLCMRAAISRDSLARRAWGAGIAFLPPLLKLLFDVLGAATGNSSVQSLGSFLGAFAELAPPIYLIAWAFRTADPKWQRIICGIAGLYALLDLFGVLFDVIEPLVDSPAGD